MNKSVQLVLLIRQQWNYFWPQFTRKWQNAVYRNRLLDTDRGTFLVLEAK